MLIARPLTYPADIDGSHDDLILVINYSRLSVEQMEMSLGSLVKKMVEIDMQ